MKYKKLALLLALIMIFSVLMGACKKSEDEDSNQTTVTTVDNGPATDANGYLLDSLPELDFGGKQINVLSWDGSPAEFHDETTADTVLNSLWERQINVENRLKVDFNIVYEKGTNYYVSDFLSKINIGLQDEDGYDLIVQYSGVGMMGAVQGYYHNMLNCEYLDFEKPWWPKNLQECLNISDSIYSVSGDISVTCTTGLFAILTNNDMIAENNLDEDPYVLAASGRWTLEKMMNMSKNIHTDLDRSQSKTDKDEFGFAFINAVSVDMFVEGSGLKIVSKREDGSLQLDGAFLGDKGINISKSLTEFITYNNGVIIDPEYGKIYPEGRAMFMSGKLDTLMYYMDEAKFSYGVLPAPKYDENQDDYKTTVNFNYSMYSIPLSADDKNMVAAVIEAMASEGYRTVTPAVFEQVFKFHYSENTTTQQMFDLVRNSTNFDIGRLLFHAFETASIKPMVLKYRECIVNGSSWSTTVSGLRDTWTKQLDVVSNALKEYNGN